MSWTIDDVVPVILTCVKTGNVFRRFVHSHQEHCKVPPLIFQDASDDAEASVAYLQAMLELKPLGIKIHSRKLGSVYESVQLAAYAALRWAWEKSGKNKPILFLEDDVVFASDFREGLAAEAKAFGDKDGMVTLYSPHGGYSAREVTGFYGTQAVLFHPKALKLLLQNQSKAMALPPGYDLQWSRFLNSRGWKVLTTERSYVQHQEGESRLKSSFHKSQRFYEPDPSEMDRVYPAAYYVWMLEEKDDYEAVAQVLLEQFRPKRVVEFGCGNGFILDKMYQGGVEVKGIDGSIHSREAMSSELKQFVSLHDLRNEWSDSPADLVVCMETAQDLPEACLDTLLQTLVRTTKEYCFFSAATQDQMPQAPNGQDRDYWIGRAADAGLWLDQLRTEHLQAKLRSVLKQSLWLAENAMVLVRNRPAGLLSPSAFNPLWKEVDGFCFINLDHRKERRVLIENELRRMGVTSDRIHRIPGIKVAAHGGIGCTLSHIAALELAQANGWENVCVLEDDFVWNITRTELQERWEESREKEWDVFLLGGTVEKCHRNGDAWYGITQMRSSPGYVVNRRYLATLLNNFKLSVAKLAKWPDRYPEFALDQYWKKLQRKDDWIMPYPQPGYSRDDVSGIENRQTADSYLMKRNLAEIARPRLKRNAWQKPLPGLRAPGKVALLFLTKAEPNLPKIWEEWLAAVPGKVQIYVHAKEPAGVTTAWIKNAVISLYVPTEFGTISIVEAQLGLLRAALVDKNNRFFVLASESCVPVKPLICLIEVLEKDGRSRLIMQGPDHFSKTNASKAERMRSVAGERAVCHSQWWILNREVAELICQEPHLEMYGKVTATDELWPGCVLKMLDYPVEERFVPLEPTWKRWRPTEENPLPAHPESWLKVPKEIALELAAGPWFFARKFPHGSDIGKYRLHLPRR